MIPNLPTDNLYKFLALSTLIASVFFLYTAQNNDFKEDEALAEFKRKMQVAKLEFTINATKENLIKNGKVVAEFEKFQKLNENTFARNIITSFVASIFSVISFLSFGIWYLKVQRPLDRILANDLAKSEYERAKLDKEIEEIK